jgi:hypothetical protein
VIPREHRPLGFSRHNLLINPQRFLDRSYPREKMIDLFRERGGGGRTASQSINTA